MLKIETILEPHNQGSILFDYGVSNMGEGELPNQGMWVWEEFVEVIMVVEDSVHLHNHGQEGVSTWIRMFKELKRRIKETEGAHVFWSACDRDPRRVELYDRMVRKMESAIGKKIHRMPIVDNDGLESILYFVTEERL